LKIQSVVRYGVGAISGSLAYVFLVFVYALFFLLEARHFDSKIKAIFKTPESERRARTVAHLIVGKVGAYMALKTLVNAILALACFAVLWAFGIELAAFWAILTGVFNYIPYVGSLIAVMLPVFVSVGQFESLETTVSLAIYLILMQNIVGYYIEPRLLGKHLNLSPLVIMISLAAWGVMWGIPGAILSVPLTSTLMILCGSFPSGQAFAVLLSEDGHPPGADEV
ncbi:MAG: AI-2E family transporter, partial [Hyphomicrobiales bacterium]